MSKLIRILVVDDHLVVRRGLCSLLIPRNGMEVVGEASNGDEAVALARSLRPDVILMDMVMPGKDGLQAITEIKQEDPTARILALTSFGEDGKVLAAITAGALGYLLKDSSADELFEAIRSVYRGNLSLSQPLTLKLVRGLNQQPQESPPPDTLTEREMDVLQGMAKGLSNQEIAKQLSIGVNTVRSHVSKILSKLGFANRTQAARYAIELGFLNDPQ